MMAEAAEDGVTYCLRFWETFPLQCLKTQCDSQRGSGVVRSVEGKRCLGEGVFVDYLLNRQACVIKCFLSTWESVWTMSGG